MDRRRFLQLAGVAGMAGPLPAFAENAAALPVIGVLFPSTEERAVRMTAALRDGLKGAGLDEGRHYAIALRFADGDMARLPALAAELDALKPRLIVAVANAALVVRQLLPGTPTVFTGVAVDVIALGWIESYARPGGMMTGNIQNAAGGEEAITTKRIGLFREMVPQLRHLGMIGFENGSISKLEQAGLQQVAAQRGFRVSRYDLQWPRLDGLDDAVASGLRDGVDAFYMTGSFVILGHVARVVASVATAQRPVCGVYPEFARAGCLMSYSIDLEYGFRMTGAQVAKVLRGAKPGDLPVEQADRFALVVNVRTARTLGLTIPDALQAAADELVE